MANKQKLVIGITGLNAIDSPGPGIAVIRCLREMEEYDIRIIGLSYESLEPGVYMHDLVDKTYQIPYPSAGSQQLFDRLMYIHSVEHLDMVIPNFDAELQNFIKIAPKLSKEDIKSFLPSMDDLEKLDKMHLHEFGKKYGYHVPDTTFVTSVDEIKGMEQEITFPIVVKGKYYEAYIARNLGQVYGYFYQLSAKWGLPVVLQQFVSGTEIDIAGLADGEGTLIGAIPIRKLYITEKGKGWTGVTLEDEEMVKLAKKFAKDSGWKGGFELELMKSEEGEYYIMEINPRFPAWIYTTAAAGQNLPAAMVRLAMGETHKPFEKYKVGTMFVRYSWELITDISEFQQLSTTGEL